MTATPRDRLSKAQVEALMATVAGPLPDLLAALATAVDVLHPGVGLDRVLRDLDRPATADALAAGDEQAAWDLAAELNERRRL